MSFATGVSFGQKDETAPKTDPTLGRYSLIGADFAAERRRSVTLPVSMLLHGVEARRRAAAPPGRRSAPLPVSLLLHGVAALALVAIPLLTSDTNPEVQSGLRAFLV